MPEFLTSSIILSLEMVGAGISKPDLGFCKHSLAFLPTYFYFLYICKEKIPRQGPGKQAALRSGPSSSFPLHVTASQRKSYFSYLDWRFATEVLDGHPQPVQGQVVTLQPLLCSCNCGPFQ